MTRRDIHEHKNAIFQSKKEYKHVSQCISLGDNMSLEQISMRVDSRLLNELDQIAKSEFKRRSDVVRDALVAHVKHEIEIRQIKEMVTKQFLEGKLCFDDFARIVSFDIAQQIKVGNETLKESIERAKKDSKRNL